MHSLVLWLLPVAFLGFFFFYPLAVIFGLAGQIVLDSGGSFAWSRVWAPLFFTTWQAALSTLLTLLVGLPAAYLFARFKFMGKWLLRILVILPFILPTVVVAAGINALAGPRGWINLALMAILGVDTPPIIFLNSLGAILFAHVFYNVSVIIRLVGTSWARLDLRLEQAARTLGASPLRTFWEVSFPLLRPSILAAGLLVFLFDFTSFGVILLLGGPRFATLEVEIYVQALSLLNLPQAALLSAIQLAATLVMIVLYQRFSHGLEFPLAPRLKGEGMADPLGWQQRLFVAGMTVLLVALLILPLAALVARSFTRLDAERGERGDIAQGLTFDYYAELFVNQRGSLFYIPPFEAALNSLRYAATAMLISLSLGTLAAYARHQKSGVNRLIEPLLMLPLGTSAVTLGLGFLIVFNRPPIEPRNFPLLIPIAHSLVALPFVTRTLQPALESIPINLRQAAEVLGASPWRVWWEVDRPILARAALVSAIFAFTISLGEFGATTFLARPDAPTLPVAIYRFLSQPGSLNYGQALAMSTILLAICALAIGLIERIGGE